MDKNELKGQPVAADMTPAERNEHVQALVGHWSRLSRKLVPLIGENGFVALLGRSARLIAPVHPHVSVEPSRTSSATVLGTLEQDFAKIDSAMASALHDELMSTFTRQLGTLIGPGLTTRLLAETADVNEQQKNREEHK